LTKAIVTGGAGFIGSYIVEELLSRNYDVVVIDNMSSGRRENLKNVIDNPKLEIIEADLKEMKTYWTRVFSDADIVFHYAANPEVKVSSINPRIHFNENLLATFNVLEAARQGSVKYIVFASTSTVYGEAKKLPTPENYYPLEPISVYGSVKLASEYLHITYSKLYGIKSLIVRYANVIGPRSKHGVIYDFILKLKKNPRELEILGDGTQRKSYIYVTDAVKATFSVLNEFISSKREYDIYNVGNSDWITVKEIADIVVEEMNLSNVRYIYKPMTSDGRGWPGDVKIMLLDISKAMSTGWKPQFSSKDAVRLTVRALIRELSE